MLLFIDTVHIWNAESAFFFSFHGRAAGSAPLFCGPDETSGARCETQIKLRQRAELVHHHWLFLLQRRVKPMLNICILNLNAFIFTAFKQRKFNDPERKTLLSCFMSCVSVLIKEEPESAHSVPPGSTVSEYQRRKISIQLSERNGSKLFEVLKIHILKKSKKKRPADTESWLCGVSYVSLFLHVFSYLSSNKPLART